jgi:hypothetical protein
MSRRRRRNRPAFHMVTLHKPFDRQRYQQAADACDLTMEELFKWGADLIVILLDRFEGWK